MINYLKKLRGNALNCKVGCRSKICLAGESGDSSCCKLADKLNILERAKVLFDTLSVGFSCDDLTDVSLRIDV